jgi:hypothetical protein
MASASPAASQPRRTRLSYRMCVRHITESLQVVNKNMSEENAKESAVCQCRERMDLTPDNR